MVKETLKILPKIFVNKQNKESSQNQLVERIANTPFPSKKLLSVLPSNCCINLYHGEVVDLDITQDRHCL